MTKAEFFSEIKNAPAAIGPYSVASRYGDLLYCSGQIGLDPATGKLSSDKLQDQARQIFSNLDAILINFNLSKAQIIKTTVFLTDMGNFAEFNQLYAAWMGEAKPPRSTVAVAALPAKAILEVEIIAGF
jgi:2-iminobutanoate/2-iminopropanoate deaminase